MGLGGGSELLLDPDVQLLVAEGQPDPAPAREMRGLGDLPQPQEVDEERPGDGLRTRGSADLHVVDPLRDASHGRGTAAGYKNRPSPVPARAGPLAAPASAGPNGPTN